MAGGSGSARARLREHLPHPRAVDLTLLATVLVALVTGVLTLVVRPGDEWLVLLHDFAGVTLAVFVAVKLVRVRHRLRAASRDSTVATSLVLAVLTLATLSTGVAWVIGFPLDVPGPWPLLVVHAGLGLLVVVPLLFHLESRLTFAGARSLGDRRKAIGYAGVALAGAAAYRTQSMVNDALATAGAERRWTGSREHGSGAGNRFPVTSWVADDPDPVAVDDWSLTVDGFVTRELRFDYDDLPTEANDAASAWTRAVLDCTSGWYSDHDWQGVRVGDLLDSAGVDADARWVQFRSVTGYRWSLPVAEAHEAILATHVDGERLSHGHGFPLRLVAPRRRGFQWVKWVESVHVTRRREVGEYVAIMVSGIDET